jgi:hypothetical protein
MSVIVQLFSLCVSKRRPLYLEHLGTDLTFHLAIVMLHYLEAQ